MRSEEHKVSVRVTEELKKSLEKFAMERGCNLSALVVTALERAVNPKDDLHNVIERINVLEKMLQKPETYDRLVLSVLEDLSYHVGTLVVMLSEDFGVTKDRRDTAYEGFLRRAMEGVLSGDLATRLKELPKQESTKTNG